MSDHEPMTVDGGLRCCPRSIISSLVAVLSLLFFITTCQSRPQAVTLALLGDISLGRGVTPAADALALLAPELGAADLALANLESPLAPADPDGNNPQPPYNLCAPSGRAALLARWHLDLLSLANNHRLDCGPDGLAGTRSALSSAGLAALSPGFEPVYRTIRGLRLAFLAFDDVSSPLDGDAAARAIHSAHTRAVVVVSIHWGAEYQGGASDRQKSLARQFAEAGAALVVGTHPHVLQPAEWINLPAGFQPAARSTLVLYSLGNALFDQGGLADTRQSALVIVKIGRYGVQSARAVPFVIDTAGSRLIRPEAETAAKIRERLQIP